MYVALTRPKNYLFVSGEMKTTKVNPGGIITPDSPLGKICEHLQIDYTQSAGSCSGDLQVLESSDNENYINKTNKISFDIPIVNSLPVSGDAIAAAAKSKIEFSINTEPVPDTKISPVISATQYVTYMQCPMKYHLRYGLHLDDLIPTPKRYSNLIPDSPDNSYDGMADEADTGDIADGEELLAQGFAEKRGIILHALLEKEVQPEQVDASMQNIAAGMPEIKESNSLSQIAETYASFVKSKTYTDIVDLGEARNEFDIQTSEGDYFLQGKIDRFIKEGDKVFIIDYKSNSVEVAKLRKLSGYYSHQLAFYSYIASKLFPDVTIFETKIVYVMHPEESVTKTYSRKQLESVKENVDALYKMINGEICKKNTTHCGECIFAVGRKTCVNS
jgi:ATP-dependent exoDNAse (exonuclease V) beta subunit